MMPFDSAMGAEPVKAASAFDLATIGTEDKDLHQERIKDESMDKQKAWTDTHHLSIRSWP
jgi:hypothetical protein